jgi:hypothetical protein
MYSYTIVELEGVTRGDLPKELVYQFFKPIGGGLLLAFNEGEIESLKEWKSASAISYKCYNIDSKFEDPFSIPSERIYKEHKQYEYTR